jgi:hypothetical protein
MRKLKDPNWFHTVQHFTTLSRGLIRSVTQDFVCSGSSVRAWLSVFDQICFSKCKSVDLATFEVGSRLQRIDESTFAGSTVKAIIIPASVGFEPNSQVHRIEECAFARSGLTQLLLPNSSHFWSASRLASLSLNAVSFWPGPCIFQVHHLGRNARHRSEHIVRLSEI